MNRHHHMVHIVLVGIELVGVDSHSALEHKPLAVHVDCTLGDLVNIPLPIELVKVLDKLATFAKKGSGVKHKT